MKRKLSAFLVVLCIIFGLSAFTACSNSKDNVITNNEFTVTFNSNGGSEISPFTGTILETLPTPIKAGFAFDGWYSTADLSGTAQTAPLNLVADISLYAKWKIAHEHAYGEWVVTTPATCTTAGTRTKTCTVCGEKVTETIPALGETHNFGDWVITTSATCATEGERTKTCSVCGEKLTEVIPAIGHSFGEWVITPATCTTDGVKTKTCSVCGEKVTEVVPATGHTFGDWIETETGLTRECMVCHHKEVATYTTGLQFEDVDVNGTMVHMVSDIGSAKGAISIPNIHDGKPVGGIKDGAFILCDSLTSIVIPSSVTIIGEGAFAGCLLTSITVDPNNANYQSIEGNLYDKAVTKLIQYAIANTATNFTIPSSVTSIGGGAFIFCDSLTNIIIPSSVTSIGGGAFYGCASLTNIIIPSSVTSIDSDAFYECTSLTSINIPSSVTSIGDNAFEGCGSLTSINIPSSVTSIGLNAFGSCDSLTSINIPSSVTSIGKNAFRSCTSLTSITVDQNNANYQSIDDALCDKVGATLIQYAVGKTATSFIIPSSVTAIGYYAFYRCTSLTSIIIPSSVTSIGDSAFEGCGSLTSIIIPSSVTSIGDSAFAGCSSLTSIIIPSNVTSIEGAAFKGCTNLSTVTFTEGSKLASIGGGGYSNEGAFDGCTSLTSISIPSSVTSIGNGAFSGCISLTIYAEATEQPSGWINGWKSDDRPVVWNCKTNDVADDGYIYTVIDGLRYAINNGEAMVAVQPSSITTANIAANVLYKGKTYQMTSLVSRAFEGCTNQLTVTFAEGSMLTSIGGSYYSDSAFYNCTSLTSIIIPSSVTSIRNGAFGGCTNLSTVTFAEGSMLTSIGGSYYGDGAFNNCTSLTSINIPSSVTSIGGYAFCCCTNLSTVTFAEGSKLTSIGDLAFFDCTSLASIIIPSSVTSIGDGVFAACTSLKSIPVDPNNANYQSIEGNLYNKEGTTLIQYVQGKNTSFTIPSSVTSIDNRAFHGCTSLTSINIPSSVTSIGVAAFVDCTSLTNIIIPSSVTSIGGWAFAGCTALTCITVDPNNANYQSIDGNLYDKLGTTLISYASGKADTSIIIPSTVTSIREAAFSETTNLSTITFAEGSKLTSIVSSAFDGCTSLTSIIIPSTVTSIGWNTFSGCTSLTIYAEAASKPAGWSSDWNSDWNYSHCPVYWFSATAPTGAPATGTGYWRYVNGVPTKWQVV